MHPHEMPVTAQVVGGLIVHREHPVPGVARTDPLRPELPGGLPQFVVALIRPPPGTSFTVPEEEGLFSQVKASLKGNDSEPLTHPVFGRGGPYGQVVRPGHTLQKDLKVWAEQKTVASRSLLVRDAVPEGFIQIENEQGSAR